MREGVGARPCDLVADTELPNADDWTGLSAVEHERRAGLLSRIAERIEMDGPRIARESPERGRQFIPFAALRGYDGVLAEAVRKARKRANER